MRSSSNIFKGNGLSICRTELLQDDSISIPTLNAVYEHKVDNKSGATSTSNIYFTDKYFDDLCCADDVIG